MSKFRLAIFVLIPLIIAVVFGLAWSVLHSEPGAKWLISNVKTLVAGTLEYGQLDGDLGSGLTVTGLNYRDADLAVHAEKVRLTVDLDLFPPLVQIEYAGIETLKIEQLNSESEPTPLAEMISSLNLPIAIQVHDLQVENLSLTDPTTTVIFAADRINSALTLDETLVFERLIIQSTNQEIRLSGELELTAPFALETTADVHLQLNDPGISQDGISQQPLTIQATLAGNLEKQLELALSSENPVIRVDGTVDNPAGTPQWKLDVQSPLFNWPPAASDPADFSVEGLTLTSEGWLDDYQFTAHGLFHSAGFEVLDVETQAQGDLTGLTLSRLVVSGDSLDVTAKGEMDWQNDFQVILSTIFQRVNPGAWIEGWPEQHPVTGKADFRLAESDLEFSTLHLETTGTPFQLKGNGLISLSEGTVAADLDWQNFAWPPGSAGENVGSSEGVIQVSGVVDNWKANGFAAIEAPGLPNGKLQVEASGDREQAKLKIVEGQALGGVISGDAQMNWGSRFQWSTNLTSSGIEIARILPEWPARINMVLSASGSTEPFEAQVKIHQLDGEYKSIPLTARGSFGYRDNVPNFENFYLNLGKSAVELNGQLYSEAGLKFAAMIEDLSSLQVHGKGQIEASGHLSLQPGNPSLALDLEATNFAWNDIRAKTISIHDSPGGDKSSVANLDINATQLTVMGSALDELEINLAADQQNQTIQLRALGSELALTSEVRGKFLDTSADLLSSGWAGEISSLTLTSSDRLALALQKPAPIKWSATTAEIELACLATKDSSTLCVEGDWVENDHLLATVKLNHVPLRIIRPFIDTDLEMTQTIDGELVWSSTANKPSSGNALFQLSAGEIRYPDDFDSLLKTGEGQISFNLEKGQLSEGKFQLPLPGIGNVDFDLNIPNVASGLDAEVGGHLKIDLADLNVITLFAPVFDQAGGAFLADLDLTGTLSEPHFAGEFSLTDGLIRHYGIGLKLDDIDLSGRVLETDKATLTGSFKALEGTGEISGKLDIADLLSPRLEMEIKGDKLKLFDAPDLTLFAEPDIRLGWQPGAIDINGSILIPSAHIAPNFIPESTVNESPDLVIVAGAPEVTETPEEEEATISIRGNLEVTLGDDVGLELDHATAELTGSVTFTWQDEPVPIANGQYSLVGQINALGQRLEISQGTIGFPGVPADNPHLNVRAEREIFGNSDIRKAGVFVTGTLRRFAMEPYTEPMTNRDRARTLLITGSDFNMEEGVGAVDIGAYIAPRIFVSYGISVFDDENVVSVRYDLGRGWGVKATSGQRQTGLDLSYTIER